MRSTLSVEDADEAAELAALARTKQFWIHSLQRTHGEIRDRVADENDWR
jgi:hypothetical protein